MEVTYLKAINQALHEEMRRDENVFVMGEDVAELGGAFKVTEGLLDAFGEDRVIDTPISEALIVGAGIGAAMLGMRPVVEMQFADFISCAFDQIVNMAATLRYRHGGTRLVPAGDARAVGRRRAWRALPFAKPRGLVHPRPRTQGGRAGDPVRRQGPAEKRDPRRQSGDLLRAQAPLSQPQGGPARGRFHRADRVGRVAAGRPRPFDHHLRRHDASVARRGANRRERRRSQVEVLDLRTLLPLDREAILATARKTGKVLIVHEDRLTGGIGGEVAAIIAEHAFDYLDGPVRRVAALDTHTAFSPPLEESILPNTNKIVEAIRELAAY